MDQSDSAKIRPQMKNRKFGATGHEKACQRVATRFRSRIFRSYVARKLRSDPVYSTAYNLMRASDDPVLDVGCGLGLLAFYLRERGFDNPIVGLDRDRGKIAEANRIAHAGYDTLEFFEHDMREPWRSFSGNVAVLDSLHYLAPVDQKSLLMRLSEAVAVGAVLVLRDCPRDRGARFWMTYLAEKFAQGIAWNVATPLHFPSRESITENFPATNFNCETTPLWGGTPFNNHLFTFHRHSSAAVPVAE